MLGIKFTHISERDQVCCSVLASLDFTHVLQDYNTVTHQWFKRTKNTHTHRKQCLYLTHWGRVTQICVTQLITIGSDNGLSPGWRQAINWTSAGILFIGPLETNFNEILIKIFIDKNASDNVICEMSAILPWPQCVNGISCRKNKHGFNDAVEWHCGMWCHCHKYYLKYAWSSSL